MQISGACHAFPIEGTITRCDLFGHGHINKTYHITTSVGKEYILQNINQYVFPEPVKVMENVSSVTNFLREKDSEPTHAIHYLPTREGAYYYLDSEGLYWRMYDYISGFCLDAPESEDDFYQSALAFGRFQTLLADYPAHTLHQTIPNFHNTVDRYRLLRESMEADPMGRLANVGKEIAFIMDQEELACSLQRLLEQGALPLRVTHNDTKLNNVLLDKATRKALCVLDLDTVMPGLSLHDFGDSIRFGAATGAEDEQDLSKMSLDLHLFEVYTRGFLESATALTEKELELLPLGAFVITLELGTRFLKDYLDGDRYFGIAYPEHNLVRARAQLKLARDMLDKLDDMKQIVASVRAAI